MGDLTITQDGSYPLRHKIQGDGGDRSILYVSGEFGSATAKLQYINGKGNYIDLEDGNLETNKQYFIEPGAKMTLYITVVASDATTDIDVLYRGIS